MDKESIAELYAELQELNTYLDYFGFTAFYSGDSLAGYSAYEKKKSNDIDKYDYDLVYKRIGKIANRIKDVIIRSQLKG